MSADARKRQPPGCHDFPPGPRIRQSIKDALSAFHPASTEEVARRIGRTTPLQIRDVETTLIYLRERCEIRQDDDGRWRAC